MIIKQRAHHTRAYYFLVAHRLTIQPLKIIQNSFSHLRRYRQLTGLRRLFQELYRPLYTFRKKTGGDYSGV